MGSYGRELITRVGKGIKVSADGNPLCKAGGITIAWPAVTAQSGDAEIRPEGETVDTNFLTNNSPADDYAYDGEKYLRYGTVVCRISGGTYAGKFAPYGSTPSGGTLLLTKGDMFILNQTIHEYDYSSDHGGQPIYGGLCFRNRIQANYGSIQTITISATGGTFTITYKGQTTSAQAYNDSAANVQADLEALSTIGTGNVTVSLSGAVYTITLSDSLGVHELFTTNPASLTGGSQTAVVAQKSATLAGPTQAEFDAAFPQVGLLND